jgi:hypothetical protein
MRHDNQSQNNNKNNQQNDIFHLESLLPSVRAWKTIDIAIAKIALATMETNTGERIRSGANNP